MVSGYLYETHNDKTDLEDRLEILKGEIESETNTNTNSKIILQLKLIPVVLIFHIFSVIYIFQIYL